MSPEMPHLPEQVPIDAYGDGGFRFSGMRRRGSLLCLPSGLYSWRPNQLTDVTVQDLQPIIEAPARPPFVLFGVGAKIAALPGHLRSCLDEVGVYPEVMDTGAASRTYNVLLAEGRPVAAALLQVA